MSTANQKTIFGTKSVDDNAALTKALNAATANFEKQKSEIEALQTKCTDLQTKLTAAVEGGVKAQEIEDLKNEIADLQTKQQKTISAEFASDDQKAVIRKMVGKSFGAAFKKASSSKTNIDIKSVGDVVTEGIKALNITNPEAGGLAVAEILVRDVIEPAREFSPILMHIGTSSAITRDTRQLVVNKFPSVTMGVENVAGVTLAETDTQEYTEVKSKAALMRAKPRMTLRSMNGTDLDVYGQLVQLLATEIGVYWAAQALYGDGADENMRGILASSRLDITATTGESWKPTLAADPANARSPDYYPVKGTGVSGAIGADDNAVIDFIIDVKNALPTRFLGAAKWYGTRNTKGAFEKVRLDDGTPAYRNSYMNREFGLEGYPYIVDDTLPELEANSSFLIFGDLASAFKVGAGDVMQMLVDPYSVDGCVVLKYDQEMFECVGNNDAIIVVSATTNSGS